MIKRIVHQKCILPRTLRHLSSLGAQCLLRGASFVETFQVACKLFFVSFYFAPRSTQCGGLLLLRFFCGNFPSGPDSPWAAQFTPKWLSWVTEQSRTIITIAMRTLMLYSHHWQMAKYPKKELLEYAIPILCSVHKKIRVSVSWYENSYRRSAGDKTTGFSVLFHFF